MKEKLTEDEMRAIALQHLNDFYKQACEALNGTDGSEEHGAQSTPAMRITQYADEQNINYGKLEHLVEIEDEGSGLILSFQITRTVDVGVR